MELKLLQKDVSKFLGVTEDSITNWEKNRSVPQIHFLPGIINFLGYFPFEIDSNTFPGKLIAYRRILGLSQMQLGKTLNARFPYVSPTAKFYDIHHFTDGGTFDNSGGETSFQVLTVFLRVRDSLAKADPVYAMIQPQLISLPNEIGGESDPTDAPQHIFEPLAVPLGVIHLSSGNATRFDDRNRDLANDKHYGYFNIFPSDEAVPGKIYPVLPLGWQISDYALTQMRLSAVRHPIIRKVIKLLNP